MPTPGETSIADGPAGIKVCVTWGEDGPDGKHTVELMYPEDMPDDERRFHRRELVKCFLAAGVRVPGEED